MPLLPTGNAARLLREAKPTEGRTGNELAQQASLRDPDWRHPSTPTISSAMRSLEAAGYLRSINIRQHPSEPYYYRLTPTGAAERARLFPDAAAV